jgi:hypothetical protein
MRDPFCLGCLDCNLKRRGTNIGNIFPGAGTATFYVGENHGKTKSSGLSGFILGAETESLSAFRYTISQGRGPQAAQPPYLK